MEFILTQLVAHIAGYKKRITSARQLPMKNTEKSGWIPINQWQSTTNGLRKTRPASKDSPNGMRRPLIGSSVHSSRRWRHTKCHSLRGRIRLNSFFLPPSPLPEVTEGELLGSEGDIWLGHHTWCPYITAIYCSDGMYPVRNISLTTAI